MLHAFLNRALSCEIRERANTLTPTDEGYSDLYLYTCYGYMYFGGFNNLNFDMFFSLQQNKNVLGINICVNIFGSQHKTALFWGSF